MYSHGQVSICSINEGSACSKERSPENNKNFSILLHVKSAKISNRIRFSTFTKASSITSLSSSMNYPPALRSLYLALLPNHNFLKVQRDIRLIFVPNHKMTCWKKLSPIVHKIVKLLNFSLEVVIFGGWLVYTPISRLSYPNPQTVSS